MNTTYEDKKCRICGLADEENEFVFHTRDRYLVKKIAAVYSIWVTPTDPLPKCICSKCVSKVTTAYKSFTQVKKLQTKWLENVATREPNHNYVQVLSFIERANSSMKSFIETNYGDKISKEVIESLLISALSGLQENSTAGTVVSHEQGASGSNSNQLSNGVVDIYEISPVKSEEPPITNNADNDEDMSLAKMATNKNSKLSPTPTIEVKCKYCPLKFESLKQLAVHQISHMQLSVPKLFQPKCLDKNFRRGRLISVQSRQSIRCLNCYLVFDDNKCILEHWSKAECDFYCQICGEEFAQSPKLLREHVSEVHGISYRSLKMQRDLSFLSLSSMQPMFGSKSKQKTDGKVNLHNNKLKVLPTKMEFSQSTHMEVTSSTTPQFPTTERTIKCRICNRHFRNFKACNSHMRAHKPPYAYNDTEQLPDMNTDAYMEPGPESMNYEIGPSPPKQRHSDSLPPPTCTSTAPTSSIPPSPAATTSTAYFNETDLKSPLSKLVEYNEPIDMELETIQVNSSTTNNNYKSNNHTTTTSNSCSTNTLASQSALSPTTSKASTSTAPRGIRMKFVNRRSDLNAINPAIKIKSINDLKATQNVTATCSPPLHAASNDSKAFHTPPQLPTASDMNAIQSLSTPFIHTASSTDIKPIPMQSIAVNCPPLQVSLTKLNPNQDESSCPPQMRFDSIRSIQNVSTCAPAPPQHTSVIVNTVQHQPLASFNSFEPQLHLNNTFIPNSIKDEPMEFI